MNGPRFAVSAWRAGLLALVGGVLSIALFCLSLSSMPHRQDWIDPIGTAGGVVLTVLAVWLIYLGVIWLDRWQRLPESFPSRRPWLRRFTIPLLCVFGALFAAPGGADAFALTIVLGSFALALRRLLHRSPSQPNPWWLRLRHRMPMLIFIGLLLVGPLFELQQNLPWPCSLLIAAATIGIWLADMWRHRAFLHPKFARS